MANPTVRNFLSGGTSGSATTITITSTSSFCATGDLLVAMGVSMGNDGETLSTFAAPAGWTLLTSKYSNNGNVGTFWRIADSTDDAGTSYAFTSTDLLGSVGVVVYSVQDVYNATTPFETTTSANYTVGTTTPQLAPSATAVGEHDLMLVVWSTADTAGGNYTSIQAGITVDVNSVSATSTAFGAISSRLAAGHKDLSVVGATGTSTATPAGTGYTVGTGSGTFLVTSAPPASTTSAAPLLLMGIG